MAKDILIRAEHLTRDYNHHRAVDSVSFELTRGEVLGFLGPNGAGKSTTMQMLAGNLAPSAGRVTINGHDLLDAPRAAKAQLGYLPEQPPLYRELTVNEYLDYCARLNRVPRPQRAAALTRARQRCGLEGQGKRLIGNLSKGYQQRVGIAQAILHNPAVVILDEPTVGLDPIQIREIRTLIRELGEEHGIILSTHILPEVQAVCSRVQIIHQGRLVFSDSIDGLEHRLDAHRLVLGLRRPPPLAELGAIDAISAVEVLADGRLLLDYTGDNPAESLSRLAAAQDWGLYELSPQHRSLEQIFVELTCGDNAHAGSTEAAA